MDTAIAELIGSGGASMYRGYGGAAAGPSMQAQAGIQASAGVSGGSNGTAILLLGVVVFFVWFYWANKGMMR